MLYKYVDFYTAPKKVPAEQLYAQPYNNTTAAKGTYD